MNGIMGHFSSAGMPWDGAERSLRLFVREVLPELHRWQTEPLAEPRALRAAGTRSSSTAGRQCAPVPRRATCRARSALGWDEDKITLVSGNHRRVQ